MQQPVNDGGEAFPLAGVFKSECNGRQKGMTLRQWYAGKALEGWAAGRNRTMEENNAEKVAAGCLRYADAMIAAEQGPSRLAVESGRLCREVLDMAKGLDKDTEADNALKLAWHSLVTNCLSSGAVLPEGTDAQ